MKLSNQNTSVNTFFENDTAVVFRLTLPRAINGVNTVDVPFVKSSPESVIDESEIFECGEICLQEKLEEHNSHRRISNFAPDNFEHSKEYYEEKYFH